MDLGPILRAMSRNKVRFGLIAAQIAVTLAIVANCVTLIQDARRKMSYPKTFDEDNLIWIQLPYQGWALRDKRRENLWVHEIAERLRGIPGVRAVSITIFAPFFKFQPSAVRAAGSGATLTKTSMFLADEQLPGAVGMDLDEGRWFSREEVEFWIDQWLASDEMERTRGPDGKAREPLVRDVVISRALGHHLLGEGPLVGKMLEGQHGDLIRIVGVIGRFHHANPVILPGIDATHVLLFPGVAHNPFGGTFIARAEPGQTAVVARRVEQELSKTFDLAEKSVWLLSEGKDMFYGFEQMTVALLGLLVLLLLLVASLGIAGLTSFSVTERTRQIGTRRALGATTADILRYFLMEAGLLTTMGLLVGAGLAVLLNMALLRVYIDAKLGAGVVAASALVLWIVGLGAALPPALRGARTSPAIATRNV